MEEKLERMVLFHRAYDRTAEKGGGCGGVSVRFVVKGVKGTTQVAGY